jgi:hypothetical protein
VTKCKGQISAEASGFVPEEVCYESNVTGYKILQRDSVMDLGT